jgi:hypothetical protein
MPESDAETLDALIRLLISGVTEPAARHACMERFSLTAAAADKALAEARRRITLAADYHRDEELGTAVTRLNDLYARSIKVQDVRTALQAQRELNRLMDLYSLPAESEPGRDLLGLAADHEAARAHLAPLRLAQPHAPLAEHARLAVARILELQERLDA